MSQVLEIFQVDAFTSVPFGGNPAGVVVDARLLSEEQMRRIAAEMNVAETAFVSPATRPGADFRIRWFTPSGKEVAFCGHATVATVHVLIESARLLVDRIVFDTLGGPLPVTVSRSADGVTIWLEPAVPALAPDNEPVAPVLDALGIGPDALAPWARPGLTPEGDLLLPAASLAVLKGLAPDRQRLGSVGAGRGIRGFCLTSRETFDEDSLIASRFFAPHFGIPEDPVTGSVHASLAIWLWEAGLLAVTDSVAAFKAEQGDLLGRPGRLALELHLADGRPARVRVGGRAVTVLAGSILVR